MTQPDQEQLDALFSKAVKVLGRQKLQDMPKPQFDLWVGGMERLHQQHGGDTSKVTEDEIRGVYWRITEFTYPTSFVAVRDAYLERLQDN
jgi:hypothetical protein